MTRTRSLELVASRGKYDPINPCPKHKAFEADNCPGCGTSDKIR